MRVTRVTWWFPAAAWLACAALPGCSETAAPQVAKKASQSAPDPRRAAASAGGPSVAQPAGPTQESEKKRATGAARRHPFVPVFDLRAARAPTSEMHGPLALKGVLGGPERTAIVEQGREVHFLREGDTIGRLKVLAVREGEVVLNDGRRTQVLALYEE